MIVWLALAVAATPAEPAEPSPELVAAVAPIRETDHPIYLDANDQRVPWSTIRSVAHQTDVMGPIRSRRAGKMALRILFTGATVAEAYGTVALVQRESDWAWVMGAQTGFTGLAAALLLAEIPRNRRIERAEMLAAANARIRIQAR